MSGKNITISVEITAEPPSNLEHFLLQGYSWALLDFLLCSEEARREGTPTILSYVDSGCTITAEKTLSQEFSCTVRDGLGNIVRRFVTSSVIQTLPRWAIKVQSTRPAASECAARLKLVRRARAGPATKITK